MYQYMFSLRLGVMSMMPLQRLSKPFSSSTDKTWKVHRFLDIERRVNLRCDMIRELTPNYSGKTPNRVRGVSSRNSFPAVHVWLSETLSHKRNKIIFKKYLPTSQSIWWWLWICRWHSFSPLRNLEQHHRQWRCWCTSSLQARAVNPYSWVERTPRLVLSAKLE